jgi:hypothetical protein
MPDEQTVPLKKWKTNNCSNISSCIVCCENCPKGGTKTDGSDTGFSAIQRVLHISDSVKHLLFIVWTKFVLMYLYNLMCQYGYHHLCYKKFTKNLKCPSVKVLCDEVTEPSMLYECNSSYCSTLSSSAASSTFFPQDKCIFCRKKCNGKMRILLLV